MVLLQLLAATISFNCQKKRDCIDCKEDRFYPTTIDRSSTGMAEGMDIII